MSKEKVMPKLEEEEVATLISILQGRVQEFTGTDLCLMVARRDDVCTDISGDCSACAINSKEAVITWLSRK